MPIPKLPLPSSPHALVFTAVVAKLKSDPTLGNYVRTWRAWEGDPTDAGDPAWDELPWVRLTPAPAPADWVTTGQHVMPLAVRVETRQEGSRVVDSCDLWWAIVAALFPGDQSLYNVVNPLGVVSYAMTQPTYGAFADSGQIMLIADGHVVFNLLVPTNP